METNNENIDEEMLLALPKFPGAKPSTCISGTELERLISQPHLQILDMPVVVEVETDEGPALRRLYLETLLELPKGSLFAKSGDLGWRSGHIDVAIGIEPERRYYLDHSDHKTLTEPPQEERRYNLGTYIDADRRRTAEKASAAAQAANRQHEEKQQKPEVKTLPLSPERRELSIIAEGAKIAQKSALPSRFCLVSGGPDQLTITKPVNLTMREWQEEIEHRVRGDSKAMTLLKKILANRGNIYQVDERWLRNLLGMLEMDRSRMNQNIADQIIQRFTPQPNKQISFGFSYQTQRNPSPFDEGLKIELLKL
ncbi:hypothetical protein HOD15_04680 [Candidatus Peregrinibacteria bacterium]|nr:hypothetical protein [Candidatus Peregrinibacteria bacterium]